MPYNYYVHLVELLPEELEEWLEVSNKLKTMGWAFSEDKDTDGGKIQVALQKLLNRRRRILEQAIGKVDVLRHLLSEQSSQ